MEGHWRGLDLPCDCPERLETLPGHSAMMGLNVWSEYQITRLNAEAPPTPEDQVIAKAAREYGVKEFWPNYSQLLESARRPTPGACRRGTTTRTCTGSPRTVGPPGRRVDPGRRR